MKCSPDSRDQEECGSPRCFGTAGRSQITEKEDFAARRQKDTHLAAPRASWVTPDCMSGPRSVKQGWWRSTSRGFMVKLKLTWT